MTNEHDADGGELDALLVRNLGKVNAAVERLWFSVEPQVRSAIDDRVRDVAEEKGWTGTFNLAEHDLWLAPEEWIVRGEEEADPGYLAHAWFDVKPDGADGVAGADHTWVLSVCGEGRDPFGIWLNWDKELGTTRPKWIKAVVGHSAVPALLALGYVFDEASGSFFRQVAFSSEALASGLTDRDLDDFLSPLDGALAELPEAMAAFQELVDAVLAKRPAD